MISCASPLIYKHINFQGRYSFALFRDRGAGWFASAPEPDQDT